MKITIKAKLMWLLGFGGLAVCIVGGYAASRISLLGDQLRQSVETGQRMMALKDSAATAQVSFKTQVQEWKNILIRGNDAALYQRYFKQFSEMESATIQALGKVASGFETAGLDASAARTAIAEHATLGQKYRNALKNYDAADPETGKKVDVAVRGMDRPLGEAMQKLDESVGRQLQKMSDEREMAVVSAIGSAQKWLLGGMAVTLAALLGGGWLLGRTIVQPLEDLRRTVRQVEENGDLTRRVPVQGEDELAQCGKATNAMLEHFQLLVMRIGEQCRTVSAQADSIKREIDLVNHSTGVQTSATNAVSAAIEELSVSVGQVGEYTQENAAHADRSQSAVEAGRGAAERGNSQLHLTATRVQETVATLDELGRQAQNISGIVLTVREIADQTNLLALNAAIEAARAGETGRGFAVVADEVRKLAEKTTRSTQEIGQLVEQIHASAFRSIEAMQEVATDFSRQMDHANAIAGAIDTLQESASQSAEASNRISEALREQTSTSQLIAGQVEQISSMCGESNQAISNVKDSSRSLHAATMELLGSVSRFRVG